MGNGSVEKFTLFYGHSPKHGDYSCFSQWYPCTFTVDNIEYNCAEQYMMAAKAILFADNNSLYKIMSAKHPRDHKLYGRHVQNYNEHIWERERYNIVFHGNVAKFQQNTNLYKILKSTAGTTLVECSPTDSIWGNGLDIKDPACYDRSLWRGKNLLGETLTKVREYLMKNEF